MQALVTLVTLVRALHESLREFTQKFMKVSINWWTVDVREADGVRGQVMYAGRKRKQNVKSWQLSAVS